MKIFNLLKAMIMWLRYKENREIGIEYTKKVLDMLEVMVKFTSSPKDDKAAMYIAKKFHEFFSKNDISYDHLDLLARHVTEAKGSIQEFKIEECAKGIKASVGKLSTVNYNPDEHS